MKKTLVLLSALLLFNASMFSSTFFSGYAGGKIGYTSSTSENPEATDEKDKEVFNPDMKLQAFFAGQFNFTQNTWGRMEFSIDTDDFIDQSLFTSTDTRFQVDELSLTLRKQSLNLSNYFSTYMGTYDPIGSDIFLQRYFSIEEIASKITDSWLGMDGSILYPHFGIGISDVLRLYSQPIAFGGYLYLNQFKNYKFYVFNSDLRFACNYRYFTCDFACGIGTPFTNKYKGQDAIIVIEKIYWHCGTTLLFGNNYTQSLFAQAGIFNAEFSASSTKGNAPSNDAYLLLEPRFIFGKNHLNITAYSLPSDTVTKLQYLDDTLGVNLNFYSEALSINGSPFILGCHTTLSFTDKYFSDLPKFGSFFATETRCFNVNVIPYISTNFLSGELNALMKISCMKFKGKIYEAFSADIGYKCKI